MSHIPCPVCSGFKMVTNDGVKSQCSRCVGEGAVNQKTGRPDSWVEPVEPEPIAIADEPIAPADEPVAIADEPESPAIIEVGTEETSE